jgi:two-component system chemotaxis response regulator CheY
MTVEEVTLSSLRVLVADPNAYLAELTSNMLRSLGIHKVVEVNTSLAAIKALNAARFDAMLVDDELTPMNGIELTRQLRVREGDVNRYLPVIMVFSHAELNHIQSARDAGVTEFIRKPMSAKVIEMRLRPAIIAPRPFVTAAAYVGPDRRRRRADFDGDDKRSHSEK